MDPLPKSLLKELKQIIETLVSKKVDGSRTAMLNHESEMSTDLVGYIPAPGPGKRSLPPIGLTGGYTSLHSKPRNRDTSPKLDEYNRNNQTKSISITYPINMSKHMICDSERIGAKTT